MSDGQRGQHRRAVQDELLEKPKLYQHFSSNGHSINDMKFFAIEVVKGDVFTLEARERYWIDKLCTITKRIEHEQNIAKPFANSLAIILKNYI